MTEHKSARALTSAQFESTVQCMVDEFGPRAEILDLAESHEALRAHRDAMLRLGAALIAHEVMLHPVHRHCASGCVLCSFAEGLREMASVVDVVEVGHEAVEAAAAWSGLRRMLLP